MSEVAVVTGAAGGIGLELCRQLAESGRTVVACPRATGSDEMSVLARAHAGRLHEVAMDVADGRAVAAAARRIADLVDRVDLLFNNAGIYPDESGGLAGLDLDAFRAAFEVNAVAPLRVTQALLPLLRRGTGRRVIQITSLMGSIGDNSSGGSYAYRMSKAALNMASRNLAHELRPEGFVVLAIHPGWVRTRMGGPEAPLGAAGATQEILRVALGATLERSGSFLGPGAKRLPY